MNRLKRKVLLNNIEVQPAIIEALIMEETVKTIIINYQDKVASLQKSLIKFKKNEGNKATLTIPFWLFTLKFPKLRK